MSDAAYKTYLQIISDTQADPEYLALEQRLRELDSHLRAMLQALPGESQSTVMEYIGICGELQNRLLELACFSEQNDKL